MSEPKVAAGLRLDGLRVVVALYYYPPYTSGLTIHAQMLAEDLARRGAQVTVVTTRHQADLSRHERLNGVDVVRVRPLLTVGKGPIAPAFLTEVVKRGRRSDVVVPVLPLAEAGVISLMLPRARCFPIYVCDLRLGTGLVARAIEAASAASARIAVSRAPAFSALSADYARASRVVARHADRAISVAPPVEPERFVPRDAGELRARLGVGDGPVVGFVGRIVSEKGLPVLVEAMRAVRDARPEVKLVIAGEGETVAGGGVLGELRRAIADDAGVHITGHLSDDDLVSFYSLCSVLALPSIDPLEAYGIVQVEAMLCGCPVVASDLPGVAIPVKTSGMGRLAPPGDAAALADALLDVLAQRDAYEVPRGRIVDLFDPEIAYSAMAEAVSAAVRRSEA